MLIKGIPSHLHKKLGRKQSPDYQKSLQKVHILEMFL